MDLDDGARGTRTGPALDSGLFELMVRASADGMLAVDPDGHILFANEAAADLLGRAPHALLGAEFGLPLATEEPVEVELLHRGRHPRVAELRVANAHDGTRVAMLRDVSQRVRLRHELQRLALADTLTGVGNRRAFLALGEQALKLAEREGQPAALLFVDVDNMKQINDRHGHPAGDRAVIATARMLTETVRDSDIVARVGGDEFCVLLGGAPRREVLQEGIHRVEESAAAIHQRVDFPLSVTVGAVLFDPAAPVPIGELMDAADRVMYQAKRRRRQVRLVLNLGDPEVGATVEQALEGRVRVTTLDQPEAFARQAASAAADLLLIDADTPSLGRHLRELRQQPATSQVPMVVWRADGAMPEIEGEAFDAGADEVLSQQTAPAVVRARLARLLHH